MKAGTKVRVTKVGVVAGAPWPTASKQEYDPGMDNGAVSPPVEYEVQGTLVSDMTLGGKLYIDRTHRNGFEAPGGMITSHITSIAFRSNGVLVTTRNSVYLVVPE